MAISPKSVPNSETIVATYHFPPPAFGRIESSGAGYRFEPVS